MPSRRELLLILGCVLTASLVGVAIVALFNGTCREPLICRINPNPDGPYCLPSRECDNFVRNNMLIVAATTLAGVLIALGAVAARRRRKRRG